MTCTWIQITNYESQGDHVYLQMTHTCAQMSSIWKRATLKSVIYHIDLRATPRLDHVEKGLELMCIFSSFLTCIYTHATYLEQNSYNKCVPDGHHM